MPRIQKKPYHDPFEDEINRDPAAHFLSPVSMYECDDWADDSDDDAEEVEWDAGITDFSLFQDERRQAQRRNEQIPDRWDSLLSSQKHALQRAVQRNRADSDPTRGRNWAPLIEDVPQLTPDNSPNLRDDFDIEAYCGQNARRPSIPNYLRLEVTPPEEETDEDDDDEITDSDDDELPVAFLVERARERRRQARKMERPGMRFNRTMSGRTHVWRRPSWHIYDVGEDAEAERKAELANVQERRADDQQQQQRGRRR
ncbi:hypothetical protein HII31_00763 [Pseudocercospora fuligena]|uniref:Uncharacterized protein n=1 Tax=Pseudocercospora fuligena TaxID=685502 RepID=A0A8H6VFF4_9PEZI|nr:hypothetical protein HII31_09283 [Pseudocercospora fuligena]KAF7189430.1 hypothetical protein HII31_09275 [Pseudocercospora fuligena]KAF7197891.1 hypothetical protein HII31_00763 [Pseudocercospora fuligena]